LTCLALDAEALFKDGTGAQIFLLLDAERGDVGAVEAFDQERVSGVGLGLGGTSAGSQQSDGEERGNRL